MSRVAVAVVRRVDFRRTESYGSNGLQAIHLAAFHNHVEVCKAIMAEVGPQAARSRTLKEAELIAKNGDRVTLPSRCTALDVARSGPHLLLLASRSLERQQ